MKSIAQLTFDTTKLKNSLSNTLYSSTSCSYHLTVSSPPNTTALSSPNLLLVTNPLYTNTSIGLGTMPRLNETDDLVLVQAVKHRLSNEAIIAITLGICVLISSWGIYFLTKRVERRMLRLIWLDAMR
jgi:hypothetical protein